MEGGERGGAGSQQRQGQGPRQENEDVSTCAFCQNDIANIPLEIQEFLVGMRNAWLNERRIERDIPAGQYDFGIGAAQEAAYTDFYERNPAEKQALVDAMQTHFGTTYPTAVYAHWVDRWVDNPEATGLVVRANCRGNHQLHLSCAQRALATAPTPRTAGGGLGVFAKQRQMVCPVCRAGDAQIQVPVEVAGATRFVPLPSSTVFNEMYHSQDWRKAPIGPYGFKPLDIVLYIPDAGEIHGARAEEQRLRESGAAVGEAQIPIILLRIGRVIDYALTDAKTSTKLQWRHRPDRTERTQELDNIMKAPPQYVLVERLGVERGVADEHNLEIVPIDLVFPFHRTPPTQAELRASSEIFMQAQDARLISNNIRTLYTDKSTKLRDVIENFQTTVKELRERGYLEHDTLNPTAQINAADIPLADKRLLTDYRTLLTYMRNYVSATAAEQPLIKEFVEKVYGGSPTEQNKFFLQAFSEILGLPNEQLASIDITNMSAQQEHAKRIVRCGNAIYYTTQMLLRDANETPDIVPDINSAILFLLAGEYNITLAKDNKLFFYMAQAFDGLPSCTTQGSELRKPALALPYNPATKFFDTSVIRSVADLERQDAIAESPFFRIARTLPAYMESIAIDNEVDEQAILMIRCTKRIYKFLLEMGWQGGDPFMNILAYFWSMWKQHAPVFYSGGPTAGATDPFVPIDVFKARESKQQPTTDFFNLVDRNLRTHCFESLDSRTIALTEKVGDKMRTRLAAGYKYPTLKQVRESQAFKEFVNAYAIPIAAVFAEPQALQVGSIALPTPMEETRKRFEQLGLPLAPPTLQPSEAAELTPIAEGAGSRVHRAGTIFSMAQRQAAIAAKTTVAPPSVREQEFLDLSRTLRERAALAEGVSLGAIAPVAAPMAAPVPAPVAAPVLGAMPSQLSQQLPAQSRPKGTVGGAVVLGKRARVDEEKEEEVKQEEDTGAGVGAPSQPPRLTQPQTPVQGAIGPTVKREKLTRPDKRADDDDEGAVVAAGRLRQQGQPVRWGKAPRQAQAVVEVPQSLNIPQNIRQRYDELLKYSVNIEPGIPSPQTVMPALARLYEMSPFAGYAHTPIGGIDKDVVADFLISFPSALGSIMAAMTGGDIAEFNGRLFSVEKFRNAMNSSYLQYLVYIGLGLRKASGVPLPVVDNEGMYNENPIPPPPPQLTVDRAAYNAAVAIAAQRRFIEHNARPLNTLSREGLQHVLSQSQQELADLFSLHSQK